MSRFNDVVMRLPPEIPKGKPYWKKRKNELLIMQCMERATKPKTGWDIFQKLRKFSNMSGNEICLLMYGLVDGGHLRIAGCDDDCGYRYELPYA